MSGRFAVHAFHDDAIELNPVNDRFQLIIRARAKYLSASTKFDENAPA